MNVLVFNNCFNQLLDEVSKEQKQIFLIRDFNINLLNCNDEHHNVNEFLDPLASSSINPYVLHLTRLTIQSKILIDNIFSNILSCRTISRNITTTTFDHLPQFLVAPNILSNSCCNK